jgi:uncharacterized membrane protein
MNDASSSGDSLTAVQRRTVGAWAARAIAFAVFIIAFLALPASLGWVLRLVAAWDLGVLVLVGEGWYVILHTDPEEARRRAVAEDPGRLALLAVAFGASVISLLAAIVVVGSKQHLTPTAPTWLRTALGLGAIVGAWSLLHTAFALHYARLFYANPDTSDGLKFHDGPPDDADFAYFAFGIGMTFQVPDVDVTNRRMRRTVLVHEIISFAYNTAILALVIDLIAGRL